ncbi:FAD-binding protein [Streptomyces nogalater]
MARAINSEVKAGRGSPHGGVFLDVSTRMPAEVVRRRLPSMYHQFKELADVDITAEPMEVGPTCHYVMGGVAVDSDTAAARGVPGLYAAGEVGRHARLEPARRQLAVRPAGVRPPRGSARGRVRAGPGEPAPAGGRGPGERGGGGGTAPVLRGGRG